MQTVRLGRARIMNRMAPVRGRPERWRALTRMAQLVARGMRPPAVEPRTIAPTAGGTPSLNDARLRRRAVVVRQEAGKRPAAPAGRIPADERHALAIRQSLRWAERAARERDYERALGWLRMVERVEGRLSDDWRKTREAWTAAWMAQSAQGRSRPRPGRRA